MGRKRQEGLVDKFIHVSITTCFISDGMEYVTAQRKSSYLKILGMFKLKNHNIFPWKSVTCICLLFHNHLLTMHVFLVFRGGKAPLWFLLYWLHTGLLPYVSLYAERTIRIIRMHQQYFSTECRKTYSTGCYVHLLQIQSILAKLVNTEDFTVNSHKLLFLIYFSMHNIEKILSGRPSWGLSYQ